MTKPKPARSATSSKGGPDMATNALTLHIKLIIEPDEDSGARMPDVSEVVRSLDEALNSSEEFPPSAGSWSFTVEKEA